MKRFLSLAAFYLLSVARLAQAVDVQGNHENPTQAFGKDASYKLVGDTTFGWRTSTLASDIDLNGHALVMDTGGGNYTVLGGAISGSGSVEWRSGDVPQVAASILNGEMPNTFRGTFTLSKGVLNLDKPAGVDAIPGDLVIGSRGDALIKLDKPQQIADSADVTFAGPGVSGLDLQGHDEGFASLTLATHATLALGDSAVSLKIGDCSKRPWDLTKTLTIRGYKPGKDKLTIGETEHGLTMQQLARIGFAAPQGKPTGLYTAKIAADGQLTPDALVRAVDPPFDLSTEANAERAKLYSAPGLKNLAGKTGELKDGTTIDFFGDSITWQGGYIAAIDKAVNGEAGKNEASTPRKRIKLVNRGINGGGVLQLRDGAKEGGFFGSSSQPPFAELIAADKANLAVVFIGINDVWWRGTTPEAFEQALRDLVAAAGANKTKLVLATLTVRGELPDGKNSDDPKIEQYAELTRKVASETGTTLVDLRKAYITYLQNHNAQLRVDGSLYSLPSGILTYDGVHPSSQGVALLANLISDGIRRALENDREAQQ